MTGIEGTVTGILQAVRDRINTHKATVGVGEVRIGEKRRGWVNPACFVYLAPGGAPRTNRSGRTGLDDYTPEVEIVVVSKRMDQSDDEAVLLILERIADKLLAAPTLGGARELEVINIGDVRPAGIDETGVYETIGVQRIRITKEVEVNR